MAQETAWGTNCGSHCTPPEAIMITCTAGLNPHQSLTLPLHCQPTTPFVHMGSATVNTNTYPPSTLHQAQQFTASQCLCLRCFLSVYRYEARYPTPCVARVYDALPVESRMGRVQLLVPVSRE